MRITFSKGIYYIGDPCYVIDPDDWKGFLDLMWKEDNVPFEYMGKQVFAGGTAWGDGEYEDNEGNTYPVDAGLIGIIPMELIKNRTGIQYGNVFEFDKAFWVEYDEGIFKFGHIEISTRDEEDY